MTYTEALAELKKVPLSDRSALKRKIVDELSEHSEALCAKWLSLCLDDMKYTPEPEPPTMFKIMVSNIESGNATWKIQANDGSVKEYMAVKRYTNYRNYANYRNLLWAFEALDDSEAIAKEKTRNLLSEYINKRLGEPERPFPAYEFLNREEADRYGIRPKTFMRTSSGDVQRRDYTGGE